MQRSLSIGAVVPAAQRSPDVYRLREHLQRSASDSTPLSVDWRYTWAEPDDGWQAVEGFDDSRWQTGPAPFHPSSTRVEGTSDLAQIVWSEVGTQWDDAAGIWLRYSFDLDEAPEGDLRFIVRNADDVTLYLNGVAAAQAQFRGFGGYQAVAVAPAAKLREGRNVLAVYSGRGAFSPFLDLGLYRSLSRDQWVEMLGGGV